MRRLDYNRLGPANFRDVCHAVLHRVLGPTYCPYSAAGADGGRDGTFDGTPLTEGLPPGYWVAQFKHRDVENIGVDKTRRTFLEEAKRELENWAARRKRGERCPDTLVFLTNIYASGVPTRGTHDAFQKLVTKFCKPKDKWTAVLWDKAKLDTLIDGLPEVQNIWLPQGLEQMAVGQGVPLDQARNSVIEQVNAGVEVAASASYSEQVRAVVVVVEMGNETGRTLTLREARLSVDGIAVLSPSERPTNRTVRGVEWEGDGVMGALAPDHFIRFAWNFDVGDLRVADALEADQPVWATLVMNFFPTRTLALKLPIYSLSRLREMEVGGPPPQKPTADAR